MKRHGSSAAILCYVLLRLAAPAAAQYDFSLRPSLGLAEVYDGNVFSEPGSRERDVITRVSPGLAFALVAPRLSLQARYAFDAESFRENPELTNPQARRSASLETSFQPGARIDLTVRGAYDYTLSPAELDPGIGLEVGRAPAERMLFGGDAVYRLGPLSQLTADYTFTHDQVGGGASSEFHSAGLSLDRSLTSRSGVSLQGLVRLFAFDGGPVETVPVVTVGFRHELSRRVFVSLRGGPRLSDSEPEVSAELRLRLRRVETGAYYVRMQATSIGRSGVFETESVGAALSFRSPSGLAVSADPGVLWTRGGGIEAMVYRMGLELLWPVTTWLTFGASAQASLQKDGTDGFGEEIWHDVVAIRLIASGRSPLAREFSRPTRTRTGDRGGETR
jgi:hypothetical protein